MNWKQLLKTDIGALLRGGKPPRKRRGKGAWPGPLYVPTLLYLFVMFGLPIVSIAVLKQVWEDPGMGYLVLAFFSLIPPPVFLVLWWTERFLYFRRGHMMDALSVLEGMVRCNVPLPEGLRHASLDAPNRLVASVLLALSDQLNMGGTLSEVMSQLKRFFPPGMAQLVRAAEQSGDLPETLALLIGEQETTEANSERWRDWALYYGAYTLCAFPIAFFTILMVFPELKVIFAVFGLAWPPPLPIFALDPETVGWSVLTVMGLAAGVYFVITMFSAAVSYPRNVASGPMGTLLGVVPYLRNLFYKHNLSVAATLAAKALEGGANLDEALDEASVAPIHPLFKRRLRMLSERVMQGETLGEAFNAVGGWFPASFTSLARLGERSGMLPEAFERIAAIYRSDVRRMTLVLVDVVAPLGILLFGVLVLSVSFPLFGFMAMTADTLSQAV
ncbi:MAG: type II secretion system F family protein [Candidatus Hydrogenedentes bacterium]|nr:type II secretion system F family protein [Candidatus Hydrogenedentota bacterium]